MKLLAVLLAALAPLTLPAAAEMRPVPRPSQQMEVLATRGTTEAPREAAIRTSARPTPRLPPEAQASRSVALAVQSAAPVIDSQGRVRRSDRPVVRDAEAILAAARRPQPASSGGGICGRGSIKGESIPPVPGNGACGIPQAVRVTAVSGVQLSRSARMDCGTAQALDDWVRTGVLPVVGNRGGGAVALRVAAGYACRTRNNLPGARVSEHGKGRAIDISAILLADGSDLNVLRDWGRGSEGRMLRALWQKACGPFGTVLGPESDRFHQDHFHFDTARHRGGPYCR